MTNFVRKQKIILISFALMIVDFIIKTWTYKYLRLGQGINIIDGIFGFYRAETLGSGSNLYFRLIFLLCFLYFIFRITKIDTLWIFKFSIAFTFFGILGDFFDLVALGLIGGASDFIPRMSYTGGISFRYIEYLYFNLGFARPCVSISNLMVNIGLIAFIVAAILRYKDFKKILRVERQK